MSKGSWYRPIDKEKYDKNYLRLYGQPCPDCKTKGYFEDKPVLKGAPVKTLCLFCNGIGYVEKPKNEKD